MTPRTVRAGLATCLAVAIVLLAAGVFAGSAPSLRRIVVFQDGTSTQVQQNVVAQSGSKLLRLLSLVNGASVELPAVGTDGALAYLKSHPAVAGVYDDPVVGAHGEASVTGAGGDGAGGDGAGGDHIVYVIPVPAPTTEGYPWGIVRIGAADAQQNPHGVAGDGVKVAILDTGIDRTHPDLAPNIVGGFNAIAGADPNDYGDDNGHGTGMAGIIAARANRTGVIGVAPHASLFAVKVLDKNGKGFTSDGIYALGVLAARQDIRLINMSYGTSLFWPLFKPAVERLIQLGKIVVASRGNGCAPATATASGAGGDGAGGDGATTCATYDPFAVRYPADYLEVITVGATSAKDTVPGYSLWNVDVVAPGGSPSKKILTTNVGGGYGEVYGTSPAAAHVTGAVALALQLQRNLTPAQAQDLLKRTANPLLSVDCTLLPSGTPAVDGCPVDQRGDGLIDVGAMVKELRK